MNKDFDHVTLRRLSIAESRARAARNAQLCANHLQTGSHRAVVLTTVHGKARHSVLHTLLLHGGQRDGIATLIRTPGRQNNRSHLHRQGAVLVVPVENVALTHNCLRLMLFYAAHKSLEL